MDTLETLERVHRELTELDKLEGFYFSKGIDEIEAMYIRHSFTKDERDILSETCGGNPWGDKWAAAKLFENKHRIGQIKDTIADFDMMGYYLAQTASYIDFERSTASKLYIKVDFTESCMQDGTGYLRFSYSRESIGKVMPFLDNVKQYGINTFEGYTMKLQKNNIVILTGDTAKLYADLLEYKDVEKRHAKVATARVIRDKVEAITAGK